MIRKQFLVVVFILSASSQVMGQGPPPGVTVKHLHLERYYAGHRGCFVLFDFRKNEYSQYGDKVCSTRFTPCSTFKIANSLIALETGVAPDTSFRIRYDSIAHPIDPALLDAEPFKHWPTDQTMSTAFRYSVVWYYQEVATMIGKERMQSYVDSLDYGNRDISTGIDHFWLSGSLTISANEQVELVKKLVENRLSGFSAGAQEKVKGIMFRESVGPAKLYGKTGGGSVGPDSTIGWYVGFVENGSDTYVFAMNIFANSFQDLAGKRVELTKEILHGIGIL